MSQISVSNTPGFQAVTGHTVLITFPLIRSAAPLGTRCISWYLGTLGGQTGWMQRWMKAGKGEIERGAKICCSQPLMEILIPVVFSWSPSLFGNGYLVHCTFVETEVWRNRQPAWWLPTTARGSAGLHTASWDLQWVGSLIVCKTPGDDPGQRNLSKFLLLLEQVHVDTKINHENTGKTKPTDALVWTLGWRNECGITFWSMLDIWNKLQGWGIAFRTLGLRVWYKRNEN